MNSMLKLVVLLAVLAGVIFGLTFLATNGPTVDPDSKTVPKPGDSKEKLLVFRTGVLRWNPGDPSDPANRSFPGYFEAGETHAGRFWFYNPHPFPVTLQLARVSCSACSEGAVAILPQDLQQQLAGDYSLGALPFGLFPVSALASALGEAQFQSRLAALPWVRKKFKDDPQASYEIPAAPPGGAQWSLLELRFTARPPAETRTLEADFVARTPSDPDRIESFQFKIYFVVSPPFEVVPEDSNPAGIDAGEITEQSGPRKFKVLIFSWTRDETRLPPPIVDVRDVTHSLKGENDLVTVSKPEPLTLAERIRLSRERGPVLAGYHVTVTVAPKPGDSLDIGPIDRLVAVTPIAGKEGDEKSISVKATMAGGVRLANSGVKEGVMDLGQFPTKQGVTRSFTLNSDSPEIELEWDEAQTVPSELKVKVEKKPSEADRGVFLATVTAPANRLFGSLGKESVIAFKIKGEKPRRVRFPITGQAVLN